MNNVLYLILCGTIIGYIFFIKCSAPKTGHKNNFDKYLIQKKIVSKNFSSSLKSNIKIKNYKFNFHIHHWFIFLLLLILLCKYGKNNKKNYFLIGICLGGIFQGCLYDDFYKVIWLDDIKN